MVMPSQNSSKLIEQNLLTWAGCNINFVVSRMNNISIQINNYYQQQQRRNADSIFQVNESPGEWCCYPSKIG